MTQPKSMHRGLEHAFLMLEAETATSYVNVNVRASINVLRSLYKQRLKHLRHVII
jgi:hypothetical protein